MLPRIPSGRGVLGNRTCSASLVGSLAFTRVCRSAVIIVRLVPVFEEPTHAGFQSVLRGGEYSSWKIRLGRIVEC